MTKVPDNVVFYDGVCNLCNSTVQFVLKRDEKNSYFFSQIGGETYQKLFEKHSEFRLVDSILFYHKKELYAKSSAALKIIIGLGGIWRLFSVFWLIPLPIRDFIYDKIAANRYKVFGKRDSCTVPDSSILDRFVD